MTIAREDVVACYRAILGREPESEEVIRLKMKKNTDFTSLREGFLCSKEFLSQNPAASARPPRPLDSFPLDLSEMEVEYEASDAQLSQCIAQVKAEWSHLGITRPHHSVLTCESFLPENLARNSERFWASGEDEAGRAEKILDRHGFQPDGKTCVEFGCGVGRVTMGLARRFAEVHAYDISENHLALATQRAHEIGLQNIRFHLCADDILAQPEASDFFYSRIVFQHNPPPIIARLIENTLRALKSDGIAIFQVPTYRIGYRFILAEWLAQEHPMDMQMHCLPQPVVLSTIRNEDCDLLELREDDSAGAAFLSNVFVVRKRA